MKDATSFILISWLLLGILSGCARTKARQDTVFSSEKFDEDKRIILGAHWDEAGSAYADLYRRVQTTNQRKLWIELQIQILDETEEDPLKDGMRGEAASLLVDFPMLVLPHVKHLEQGLAVNRYKEEEVRNLIKEAIKHANDYAAREAIPKE